VFSSLINVPPLVEKWKRFGAQDFPNEHCHHGRISRANRLIEQGLGTSVIGNGGIRVFNHFSRFQITSTASAAGGRTVNVSWSSANLRTMSAPQKKQCACTIDLKPTQWIQ